MSRRRGHRAGTVQQRGGSRRGASKIGPRASGVIAALAILTAFGLLAFDNLWVDGLFQRTGLPAQLPPEPVSNTQNGLPPTAPQAPDRPGTPSAVPSSPSASPSAVPSGSPAAPKPSASPTGPAADKPVVKPKPKPPASTDTRALERAVLRRLNEIRARSGCPALYANSALVWSAKDHSRDMADDGRADRGPRERAERRGYRAVRSEYYQSGQRDARAFAEDWVRGDGRAFGSCAVRAVGVGVTKGRHGELHWSALAGME